MPQGPTSAEADALRVRYASMTSGQLETVSRSADYTAQARELASLELMSRTGTRPESPCVDHPSMPIVATCQRCGRFICLDCDLSFGRTGEGRCHSCQIWIDSALPGFPRKSVAVVIFFALWLLARLFLR